MKLLAKTFLELHDDYVLGPGRLALLKAVRDLGSLRKAAQHFGMSYRWAWGRLDSAEMKMGVTLMARTDDVVRGRPKQLTEDAMELIAWADEIDRRVAEVLREMEGSIPDFLKNATSTKPPKSTKKKSKKNFTLD